MKKMTKNVAVAFLWILLLCVFGSCAANANSTDQRTLKKVCKLYTQKWAGLKYHYRDKQEFSSTCEASIDGKDLLSGMWAISSLMPDGHTSFSLLNVDGHSQLYPVLLGYDPKAKKVSIVASFDKKYNGYVGMSVILMNSEPILDVLKRRAKLQPRSTIDSSLEFAARTLLFSSSVSPYPSFPPKVRLNFLTGAVLTIYPLAMRDITKDNEFIFLSNYDHPSIWGDIEKVGDASMCKNPHGDMSKVVNFGNKEWLWWHPFSMGIGDIADSFKCLVQGVEGVSGIVVDLRDTSGGGPTKVATVSRMLGGPDVVSLRMREYNRISTEVGKAIDNVASIKWKGPLVIITNGICGSACELLADTLGRRQNVCSYGFPTAGRRLAESSPGGHNVDGRVNVEFPDIDTIDENGALMEGRTFIPRHIGGGGVYDAIKACSKELE